MKLLHANSLASTLDALNEVFFMGGSVAKAEKKSLARWLASRRGLPGAYRGMFAPTPTDYRRGIKLFTGERVTSGAAIGHILGEEASRALIILDGSLPEAREALKKSNKGMNKALMSCDTSARVRGFYCCGTCTAALWRHLAVGGLSKSKRRLVDGLRVLKGYRDGTGKWRRFPFYYTLLALSEIDRKLAASEIHYVAPVCARLIKRYRAKTRIAKRRKILLEMILARA